MASGGALALGRSPLLACAAGGGLIQSSSQATFSGLSAWAEVGGIALLVLKSASTATDLEAC